ncbi:hypothetical protein HanIR_Chr12g0609141 [Helianthus annuus]|nr:hypothetical protein HanIR_Chr12g0609141 [Helianthus annuus]
MDPTPCPYKHEEDPSISFLSGRHFITRWNPKIAIRVTHNSKIATHGFTHSC